MRSHDESDEGDRGRGETRGTILLVEEINETRMMLKFLLELSGYRVIEAVNAQQAFEVARRDRPQLVLMDLGRDELESLIIARAMCVDAELRAVPIIAVSGSGAARNDEFAKMAGCAAYLTKPVNFEELARLLTRHLSGGGERAAGGAL